MRNNHDSRKLGPWPAFGDEEIAAVVEVLRSGRVNSWTGEQTSMFEKEYAVSCGVEYALAAANGTLTLELALRAFGIGPGDEVVVTPRSFVASASCVVNCGAKPVFADVDRESGNITARTIAAVMSSRTRAIIPVHLAGWPCEMDEIVELARQKNVKIIEDCAQAHGASYMNRPVGSFGDIGSFSFCQDKIMTTGGEGGMLTTNDRNLWLRLWSLREHGKSYDACFKRSWPPGFRWLHESFGTNARMTEMQAAIGRVVLRKLPEWVRLRRHNASILEESLKTIPVLRVPERPSTVGHSFYKYYCYVTPERLSHHWTRDGIMRELTSLGVPCFSGSCSEMYLEKMFTTSGLGPLHRLPIARELGDTALTFLVHPTLEQADMQWMAGVVCETIKNPRRVEGQHIDVQ